MEFTIVDGPERIRAYGFGQPAMASEYLRDASGSLTDLFVRFHRPERRGSNVTFTVSIQRRSGDSGTGEFAQWLPTPRPQQCWLDITPVSSTGEIVGPSYPFYDLQFLQGTPVPFMQCVAHDWPARATQARVHLWSEPPEGWESSSVTLSAIRTPQIVKGAELRSLVEEPNGANQDYRVRVIERWRNEQLFAPLGIGEPAFNDSVRAARIIRQFDAFNRVVIHSFIYDQGDDVDVDTLVSASLRIQTNPALLNNSWYTPDVEIPITSAGELITATK
jgi:hypothetical protein